MLTRAPRSRAPLAAPVLVAALLAGLAGPNPGAASAAPATAPAAGVAADADAASSARAGGVALRAPLRKVLTRVNAARAMRGIKPLRIHRCLTVKVAQPWAVHLTKDQDPPHRNLEEVFDLCPGFSRLGENVAWGYPTAAAVMRGWMHSEGHRDNILNKRFHRIGLGLARASDGTPYWVQNFGG